MIGEHVDLVAGDFNGTAWRCSNRNNISTIEEAFADCALPTPPVILNWPERIKTQPHDDRDTCFLHFDSKGPCGMTVTMPSMTIALQNYSDSHIAWPYTIVVTRFDSRMLGRTCAGS